MTAAVTEPAFRESVVLHPRARGGLHSAYLRVANQCDLVRGVTAHPARTRPKRRHPAVFELARSSVNRRRSNGNPAFCFPTWQSRTTTPAVFRKTRSFNCLWPKPNGSVEKVNSQTKCGATSLHAAHRLVHAMDFFNTPQRFLTLPDAGAECTGLMWPERASGLPKVTTVGSSGEVSSVRRNEQGNCSARHHLDP